MVATMVAQSVSDTAIDSETSSGPCVRFANVAGADSRLDFVVRGWT